MDGPWGEQPRAMEVDECGHRDWQCPQASECVDSCQSKAVVGVPSAPQVPPTPDHPKS